MPEDEREDLQVAGTEMIADYPDGYLIDMQLSGSHGWGRSTGALLLPVEAVISGELGRTLARRTSSSAGEDL